MGRNEYWLGSQWWHPLLAVGTLLTILVEHGPTKWSFAHAIIRDVLYTGLSRARRAHLHGRVGAALEQLPPTDERLSALAHHFSEAGDAGRVAHYSLRLGQSALDHLAYEDAVSRLERGRRALRLRSAKPA